tara:strand:- start:801 stop:1322 length:522 start_codon:yes stop_codon:yes gene_type:complete
MTDTKNKRPRNNNKDYSFDATEYDKKLTTDTRMLRKIYGISLWDLAISMRNPYGTGHPQKMETGGCSVSHTYITALASLIGCSPLDIDKQLLTNGRFKPQLELEYLGHSVDISNVMKIIKSKPYKEMKKHSKELQEPCRYSDKNYYKKYYLDVIKPKRNKLREEKLKLVKESV